MLSASVSTALANIKPAGWEGKTNVLHSVRAGCPNRVDQLGGVDEPPAHQNGEQIERHRKGHAHDERDQNGQACLFTQ